MFIGHFSLAFAAKKWAPKSSLAALLMAASFLDIIWPLFLLLGWEHVRIEPGNTVVTPLDFFDYPVSHSLVGASLWALLFGGIYFSFKKYPTGALITGGLVFSHWILDFISHGPDMPIYFGSSSPKVGLALWNSRVGTLTTELVMFAAGVTVYLKYTKAKNRQGQWGLITFLLTMIGMYLGNILGPPPPNEKVLAWAATATMILYAWPWWFDRNRSLLGQPHENKKM